MEYNQISDQEFIENRQERINKSEQEFREILQKEDVGKLDAISKACQILEAAKVPFWLFAERPIRMPGSKEQAPMDQYIQYNWHHKVFAKDGMMSEVGLDFAKNHMEALFYSFYFVMTDLLSKLVHKEIKDLTWDEIHEFFRYQVVNYSQKQQEVI